MPCFLDLLMHMLGCLSTSIITVASTLAFLATCITEGVVSWRYVWHGFAGG